MCLQCHSPATYKSSSERGRAEGCCPAVDHMRAGEAVEEGRMQVLRPVLALLQTMLPWVNRGQAPDYAAEDDAAREAARQQEHEE